MIRFRLSELLLDRAFKENRRIELGEVAEATGIHRTTLSKIVNRRGYNATTHNLDRLCAYFGCTLADLAVYVADADLDTPVDKAVDGPKQRTDARTRSGSTKSGPTAKKGMTKPPDEDS